MIHGVGFFRDDLLWIWGSDLGRGFGVELWKKPLLLLLFWIVEEGQELNCLLKNREVIKLKVYEWRNHGNLIKKLRRWRKKNKEKLILMICESVLLELFFSCVFVLCPFWFCFLKIVFENWFKKWNNNKKIIKMVLVFGFCDEQKEFWLNWRKGIGGGNDWVSRQSGRKERRKKNERRFFCCFFSSLDLM
jgi:hypothetical protein